MFLSFSPLVRALISVIALLFLLSGCAPSPTKPMLNSLEATPTLAKVTPDYIETFTDMAFVYVEGASFQMGSNNAEYSNEQPVHTVTVKDMFVGMYEVTFNQYDKFCDAIGKEKPHDEGWGREDRPVINVSWHEAVAFAAWLSTETGHQFKLPSEAEWEYFARAGTVTEFWTGETLPAGSANCRECGSRWDNQQTAPAGVFSIRPGTLLNGSLMIINPTIVMLQLTVPRSYLIKNRAKCNEVVPGAIQCTSSNLQPEIIVPQKVEMKTPVSV